MGLFPLAVENLVEIFSGRPDDERARSFGGEFGYRSADGSAVVRRTILLRRLFGSGLDFPFNVFNEHIC